MKYTIILLIALGTYGCSEVAPYDSLEYFNQIGIAEDEICQNNFEKAADSYKLAFSKIQKPFGKDLFNAALCSQLSNQHSKRDDYLQKIINNTENFEFVKSKFLNTYISKDEWKELIAKRKIEYDQNLRKESEEILKRDQLYRPMYDTHDSIINENRVFNLNRIIHLTDSIGLPSHVELGYTEYLRGQKYHLVLHHTAQRRSQDKSVLDLESLLFDAIRKGRLDPETGILYMKFQNDKEKGHFEEYSTWQNRHPLLPDSLNRKIWLIDLNDEQTEKANQIRTKWYANTLEDIAKKSDYLSKSSMPFIFTCVRTSIGNLRDDFDKETALEQYKLATSFMKEYKN